VAPVTDRLVVGIGAYNPFGLGTEWPNGWAGRFLTTKVDLKTYFVTPTASYRLTDQLSIGAGLNYVMGSVLLEQYLEAPSDPHVSISMHATGVGYNVGLLYKPLDVLSVGASYRSSVKLDASGNVSFNPEYATLPTGGASTTIKLPATGFVGVAWIPMKDLQVEADYQYIGWSSYDQLTLHFAADNSEKVSPKNYQDTYMFRFGGEYTMDAFHFRAGYVYDHSPVKTEYVDPLLPDANRNGVSLGLGYDITNHLSVDAAYFYLKFDQRVAVNTIPQTSFDGTYTSHAHLASVDFGYRF
jgi:long-chain fatty acid transport protein